MDIDTEMRVTCGVGTVEAEASAMVERRRWLISKDGGRGDMWSADTARWISDVAGDNSGLVARDTRGRWSKKGALSQEGDQGGR
ncbi:hypothetical protein E2C01_061054 [Portunus trituberculatus]|uniref:Uncharacterized protein n=1 Tax=Portunus trituberculatus TaxID=210409 RepID=A0A5B7HAP8_PORTR|nr:hypothetical protein [Portunus trituberculatus]